MVHNPLFEKIAACGIVPIVAVESVEMALPLADALLEAGLPLIEVTFRTEAAAAVIECLVRERPQMLVGAGTVLTRKNLKAARNAGAQFGVAPGLNPRIVKRADRLGLPFIPGVATPSEVEQALALDCEVLKFFPAGQLGGIEGIKALTGPYGHTGVRFMPTGGVNQGNLEAYLSLQTVAAVGGTWLAKKEELANGAWGTIRDRCRQAVETVRRVRGG